jgi:hypothetical protein
VNTPNKHKPLSSEELFQLLDKQSNTETDFDGMDDFEKEALEGFTENVSSEKAKTLTQEVNAAISKKVILVAEPVEAKNKIIWFSAAASIVLIVIISVFFLNQSKDESNIALNETPHKEIINPEVLPTQEPTVASEEKIETKSTNSISSGFSKNQIQQPIEAKEVESGAKGPSFYKEALAENKPAYAGVTGASKDLSNLDGLKKLNESDEAKQQTLALKDKITVSKEEELNREDTEKANDVAIAQNVATISANGYAPQANQKADMDSKKSEKLAKEKAKKSVSDDESVNGLVSVSKTSPAISASSEQIQLKAAYYNGGESAIKEYVVTYFKTKQLNSSIIGKYKVKGIVDEKGNLKVNSIVIISNEDVDFTENIKKALNSMKNWNPAMSGGKATSAPVEFTLQF